jgi:AcrR family transcriptional regulator
MAEAGVGRDMAIRAGQKDEKRARRRPGPARGRSPALAGTRADLLAAAAVLFAERGFDGATAELIAERAGATKAMINYHFRSKQGLYETILAGLFTELGNRLEAVRTKGGPAPDQMRGFIAEFARAATEQPGFPAMMIREVLSGGEHLPLQVFLRMVGVLGVVRAIVEQGVQEGSFRPVDPLLAHLGLVGTLLFFFASAPFRQKVMPRISPTAPAAVTPPAFVAYIQDLMVRGLAREPARRRRK